MSSLGYVKIYRSLWEKGYWLDSEYVHLWVHLLMKATYQPKEYLFNGKIFNLQPGQFIAGRKSLSKETGINESKVERILSCFKSEQQIEQQTTNKFRLISITNWETYQKCEQQIEQQMNSQRTANEQPVNTNNKEKKEKKDKKEKEPFILPEWISKKTWAAFKEMRVSKKSPLTDYAADLLIKKLTALKSGGHDPEALLNESIMKGWLDVYPKEKGGNLNAYKESYAPRKYGRDSSIPESTGEAIDKVIEEAQRAKSAGAGHPRGNA